MPRRYPIVQAPNAPALVAVLAGLASRTMSGPAAIASGCISSLSLLVWALGEGIHGANAVRRLFGLTGGSFALAWLVRLLRGRG